MCNKCIHKPICYKYTVTGGYVRDCEHYMGERQHGQWIKMRPAFPWKYRCCLCGCPNDYESKFCPKCGATMKKTEADEP